MKSISEFRTTDEKGNITYPLTSSFVLELINTNCNNNYYVRLRWKGLIFANFKVYIVKDKEDSFEDFLSEVESSILKKISSNKELTSVLSDLVIDLSIVDLLD